MNLKAIRGPLVLILGLFLMTVLSPATATAFTDLNIAGSITFDDGNTSGYGTFTDQGSMSVTSGGVVTSTLFNGSGSVFGANPLTNSLTDVGDGIGGKATFIGANDADYVTGLDLTLNLSNTSASDSFLVSFQLDYENSVDSSGDDAYGQSLFFLGTLFGDNDVFETFLISDTINGNENTDGSATGFGGLLTESGLFDFDVLLAPLTSFDLYGEYSLFGGVFEDPGTSMASFDAFLSITGVENLTAPPAPIPEPSTVVLLGFGLVGLGIMVHRRRKNS